MNIWKHLFLFACFLTYSSSFILAQEYKLEKLSSEINTKAYDETSPVLSLDGSKLYFTRIGYPLYDKTLVEKGENLSETMNSYTFLRYLKSIFTKLGQKNIKDPIASSFNQDVWIAYFKGNEFETVEHPGFPLNNALPNSICSVTPSNNEVILLNQFIEDGGMKKGFSVSRQDADNNWSFPHPLQINNYHNSGPDVSMSMSQDGSVIIIAMDRADSKGLSDLYISHRQDDGSWSEPKNMGPNVNSINRETTPFISADKTSLFFASDRRTSLGGNDIYMIKRIDDSWDNWTSPRKFVLPINSSSNDSHPFFNANTGYLYFTSSRDGTSDIFRVKIAPPNPVNVVINGKVVNSKTNELTPAKIISGKKSSKIRNVYVSDDGTYRLSIPKGEEYEITIEKPGYTSEPETISFNRSYVYYQEYTIDLKIEPMEKGSKIKLDPIYFVKSKPDVREDSFAALDKLASFLKENPYVYIQIAGHTDNQGEKDALKKLSDQRAKAVKQYLVYKKYIKPIRISTEGYGGTKPVTDNSTEELRMQNRRVEAIITDVAEPIFAEKKEKK